MSLNKNYYLVIASFIGYDLFMFMMLGLQWFNNYSLLLKGTELRTHIELTLNA